MTYDTFYARIKALLGNRTDIDDMIQVWSQDAVMIAYSRSIGPGGIAFDSLTFTETGSMADVYTCGTVLGNAISAVAYENAGGDLIRIEHLDNLNLLEYPTQPEAEPTGYTRVGEQIYLFPRLTAAPTKVMVLGATEFNYPTSGDESLPIVTTMIPGATALATAFAKIYLGETELGAALQGLSTALLALELTPKGLEDRVGAIGIKVLR